MTGKNSRYFTSSLIAAAAILSGCTESPENSAADNGASSTNAGAISNSDSAAPTDQWPTDEWKGRWTGPEGLFLDIQPASDGRRGHYAIINKDNLDRQGKYIGIAEGSTIRFVRDGKDMVIRPGSGAETGFKYLLDMENCLIVVPGQEGYCR